MNYQQAKDKIYILMNYCTFDESAIEDLFWFGVEDIKNNDILTLSQKKYLCDKIDNFHLQYYNTIRSTHFLKLNNNYKTVSNYIKFINYYYRYLPNGKLKGQIFKKLSKDLFRHKDILPMVSSTITECMLHINIEDIKINE